MQDIAQELVRAQFPDIQSSGSSKNLCGNQAGYLTNKGPGQALKLMLLTVPGFLSHAICSHADTRVYLLAGYMTNEGALE